MNHSNMYPAAPLSRYLNRSIISFIAYSPDQRECNSETKFRLTALNTPTCRLEPSTGRALDNRTITHVLSHDWGCVREVGAAVAAGQSRRSTARRRRLFVPVFLSYLTVCRIRDM